MNSKIKNLVIYSKIVLLPFLACSAYAQTVTLANYNDQQLAELLRPNVYFHPDEKYLPMGWDTYVVESQLKNSAGTVLLANPTSRQDIADASTADTDYLDLDDNYRASTTTGALSSVPIYAHVLRTGNYIDVQYAALYGYSGCQTFGTKTYNITHTSSKQSRFIWCNFARHEGDWEHMVVRLDATTGEILKVDLAAHGEDIWYDDSEISWSSTHPNVYVSVSVHSFRPGKTTYTTGSVLGGSEADLVSLATCSSGWIDWLDTVDTTSTSDFVSGDNGTYISWAPSVYLLSSDQPLYGFSGKWGDADSDNSDIGDPEGDIPKVNDSCFTDAANLAIDYGYIDDDYLEGHSPQSPWEKGWFEGNYDD